MESEKIDSLCKEFNIMEIVKSNGCLSVNHPIYGPSHIHDVNILDMKPNGNRSAINKYILNHDCKLDKNIIFCQYKDSSCHQFVNYRPIEAIKFFDKFPRIMIILTWITIKMVDIDVIRVGTEDII